MYKYFATFGSGQLVNFRVRPNDVILLLEGETENEAREVLHNEPFNGRFAFSYKIEEANRMVEQYGMVKMTIQELLELQN